MKGPLDRTKVVLRHLPSALSQAMLMEQIDVAFASRYNWVSFRLGKISQKQQSYARAYIDFKSPDDVIQFAQLFDGHVFVNEKGNQFKIMVEYAPSQRVPKQLSQKDAREGTLHRDAEYLQFLEYLEKPVENLPSAEIQLERREAERAGATKEAHVVTPLMDFVRQKRAAKGGSRRSLSNGKLNGRAGGSYAGSPRSSLRRGSERRRTSPAYVLKDKTKNTAGKDKSTYILASKRHDKQIPDKSVSLAPTDGNGVREEESGITGITDADIKKVLLLRGRKREIFNVSGGVPQPHIATHSVKNILGSSSLKQVQDCEGGGRMVRSILLNKDSCQSQSSGVQFEQLRQATSEEKRLPPAPDVQIVLKERSGASDDKAPGNDLHGFSSEKQKQRMRNKGRLDCGVWTLRRSEGSHAIDESLSSSASHFSQSLLNSSEVVRGGEAKSLGSGRGFHASLDNGSLHKHVGRHRLTVGLKDADGFLVTSDGKHSKRGGATGHRSHEKQVWVQKSSSGS